MPAVVFAKLSVPRSCKPTLLNAPNTGLSRVCRYWCKSDWSGRGSRCIARSLRPPASKHHGNMAASNAAADINGSFRKRHSQPRHSRKFAKYSSNAHQKNNAEAIRAFAPSYSDVSRATPKSIEQSRAIAAAYFRCAVANAQRRERRTPAIRPANSRRRARHSFGRSRRCRTPNDTSCRIAQCIGWAKAQSAVPTISRRARDGGTGYGRAFARPVGLAHPTFHARGNTLLPITIAAAITSSTIESSRAAP